MTDGKSIDHWNFLARQLGAAPAAEPEEESKPPEPAELVATGEEEAGLDDTTASKPEPVPAEEMMVVPEPVTPSIPAPSPKLPAPPRAPAPKPRVRNHWRELAATLGIEISEPEPEEVEAVEEMAATELSEPATPPPAPAPQMSPPEPMERNVDVGWSSRSDLRREHRRPSLFEDPDLSLDTPGVLDAVFDEIEPATAEPEDVFDRRRPELADSEVERGDRFAPLGRDDLFLDEVATTDTGESAIEVAAEPFESGESLDVEDEERPSRRRRRPRRRRRSGRREQEPAEEGSRGAADDEEEDLDEAEPAEHRGGAAPVCDIRALEEVDEDHDLEDEDQFADEDDEEGDGERLTLKHKKIPTWQEAVDAIIAVNMESRAKNPGGGGGGGGRGRGRRWRK